MISYNTHGVRSSYGATEISEKVFAAFNTTAARESGIYRTKKFNVNGEEFVFSSYYGNKYGWSGWTCSSHEDFMEILN